MPNKTDKTKEKSGVKTAGKTEAVKQAASLKPVAQKKPAGKKTDKEEKQNAVNKEDSIKNTAGKKAYANVNKTHNAKKTGAKNAGSAIQTNRKNSSGTKRTDGNKSGGAKKAGGEKASQSKKAGSKSSVNDNGLVRRTLMVAAFPSMIKRELKDGREVHTGFLPGFESVVEDIEDIGEIMDELQERLDDEIEELIIAGSELPFLPDDDELLRAYPEYEVKLLDINVWAYPDDEAFYYDAGHCGCGCEGDYHDDGCGCGDGYHDENCCCGEHEHSGDSKGFKHENNAAANSGEYKHVHGSGCGCGDTSCRNDYGFNELYDGCGCEGDIRDPRCTCTPDVHDPNCTCGCNDKTNKKAKSKK